MKKQLPGGKPVGLTVDVVIFSIRNQTLQVLLLHRKRQPYQGLWAIPGGSASARESIEQAALRELREQTGVSDVFLEQLYSFGDPGRDPRGRVVTVAYLAVISPEQAVATSADAAARWFPMKQLPPLAFDHQKILDYALLRLRNKIEYTTLGFQLLPKKFTLTELQRVYEVVLEKKLDKRNFRRKIAVLNILTPLEEYRKRLTRPAQLFEFSQTRFEKLKNRGILFPF